MAKGLKRKKGPAWDSEGVRALRQHLGMTQEQLAQELGTRQQTISEWETGMYLPRGASRTILTMVAERAAFPYDARHRDAAKPDGEEAQHGSG